MYHSEYLKIAKKHWQTTVITVLGLVVLSLVFTLIQPLEYSSKVELLVIQRQTAQLDAYSAARASEKIAGTLSSVIKTKSFFDKIITGNFGISRNYFPKNEKKLRKIWRKKIKTNISPQSNILKVEVFDTNKKQAENIVSAIAYVLVNDSNEYYGGGNNIQLKVINDPLTSEHPVKPNIILNTISALIIGLMLSLVLIFYQNKKYIEINKTDDLAQKMQASYMQFE